MQQNQVVQDIWNRASRAMLEVDSEILFSEKDVRALKGFLLKEKTTFNEGCTLVVGDNIINIATLALLGSNANLGSFSSSSEYLNFLTLHIVSDGKRIENQDMSLRLAHCILFFLTDREGFSRRLTQLKSGAL